MTVGGFLPLGYALGGLNRGMAAQTEKERYERLLDDSQAVIEEQQEEIESMEAEAEEEKEAEAQEDDYRYDYLSTPIPNSIYHQSVLSLPSVKKESFTDLKTQECFGDFLHNAWRIVHGEY